MISKSAPNRKTPSKSALIAARKVRRLMEKRGWSQNALAQRVDVSQRAVSYLLNYKDAEDRHPTIQTIDLIAAAFGYEGWELLRPADDEDLSDSPTTTTASANTPDADLLRMAIEATASELRAQGRLPSDSQLASAAVFVYTRALDGINLKRAAADVTTELERMGMKLAAPTDRPEKGGRRSGSNRAGVSGRSARGTASKPR